MSWVGLPSPRIVLTIIIVNNLETVVMVWTRMRMTPKTSLLCPSTAVIQTLAWLFSVPVNLSPFLFNPVFIHLASQACSRCFFDQKALGRPFLTPTMAIWSSSSSSSSWPSSSSSQACSACKICYRCCPSFVFFKNPPSLFMVGTPYQSILSREIFAYSANVINIYWFTPCFEHICVKPA